MSARKTSKPVRRVYSFGDGKADGDAKMKELLGGKGANLAEMTRLGLPVPPGFTIATTVCAEYQAAGDRIPKSLDAEIAKALVKIERVMSARFGDAARIEAECRDIGHARDRARRRMQWLEELAHDARYALRQLRASPRFTAVAVLTLAIGLGASTTIFGIADAVLLRPCPSTIPAA